MNQETQPQEDWGGKDKGGNDVDWSKPLTKRSRGKILRFLKENSMNDSDVPSRDWEEDRLC